MNNKKTNAYLLYIGKRNITSLKKSIINHSDLILDELYVTSEIHTYLQAKSPDLIILEYSTDFQDFLSYLSFITRNSDAPVIVTSTHEYYRIMVKALRNGADNFLCEPYTDELLIESIYEALRMRILWKEIHVNELQQMNFFGKIIGSSPPMQALYKTIMNISQTSATVFIVGESGTGKELVAKAIHDNGPRSNRDFVAINCGAIPPNLLESELFGHEKGAFTGAIKNRKGKFEQADNSTIFLDEICEMPLDLQVKLLRVLQERKVTPIGKNEEITVNARVICATNKPPIEEVKAGRFREDLYYRLNVVPVKIPSLKDRRQDIPLLCAHFLHIFTERYNKYFYEFSPAALNKLCAYDWPGNVRELENILERIVVLHDGAIVEESFLPEEILSLPADIIAPVEKPVIQNQATKQVKAIWKMEKEMIINALIATDGNVTKSSKMLEIGQASLYRKLKKYSINRYEFIQITET
jgi:two-component system repressor protein LuxO